MNDYIKRSAARHCIVHAAFDSALALDLLVESDDSIINGRTLEFWSDDWRVHLDLLTSEDVLEAVEVMS